ncbi:MAG: hypothetical protein V1880_00215 [Patescibacteria group bacterium]
MSKFKFMLPLLMVLTLLAPVSAFANITTGYIAIEVVDQDGHDIAGNWYLYQGTGDEGLVVRNGTWGETFTMPYGTYYLKGEVRAGYSSFAVVSENAQTILPHYTITYRLAYTAEVVGDIAPATGSTEDIGAVVPPVESPVTSDVMTPGAVDDGSIRTVDTEVISAIEERLSHTGRPVGVDRSALETPSLPATPVQLAVTGPEGILGLLMLGSSLGSLWIVRRRA